MENNLEKKINIILDEYVEELGEDIDDICEQIAGEAVTELKATSPRSDKATRHYADGWTHRKEGEHGRVVYNKSKPSLTYLLNNGHQIANQYGRYERYDGDGHIDRVEEKANVKIVKEVEKRL